MKTKITALIICFVISANAQKAEKQELLTQINNFRNNSILNRPYDVTRQQVWDATYVMMKQEYPEIKNADQAKGIIEGYSEADRYKEHFTSEIVGTGPYRVVFTMKRQVRDIDQNGRYSGWFDANTPPPQYLYKIQNSIYTTLYGPLQYSPEIMQKINAYNDSQKKDKNKLVYGRDY